MCMCVCKNTVLLVYTPLPGRTLCDNVFVNIYFTYVM
jgi:hypothetical protein